VLMKSRNQRKVSVAIANGAALSSAIDIRDAVGGLIQIPAAITGNELRWLVSGDGTTYSDVDNSGVVIANTLAASRQIPIPTVVFGAPYLKVQSYTTGASANQAAARTLVAILKS